MTTKTLPEHLQSLPLLLAGSALLSLGACANHRGMTRATEAGIIQESRKVSYAPKAEQVFDFGKLVPERSQEARSETVRLERVTTAVPWPRGLAWYGDDLLVLARGRHRRAGGIDPKVVDHSGSIFKVDPRLTEPVVPGELASKAIRENGEVYVRPKNSPFYLYDGKTRPELCDRVDRPYCTLTYDPVSKNIFLCGFSGIDLPGAKFRKNATDSIHRYDMRDQSWHEVEMHDASKTPPEALGYVVPNDYYPHHDPARHAPPHGYLNGPDSAIVVGSWLYAAGKDNHLVVSYDLRGIRERPDAKAPPSAIAVGPRLTLRYPGGVKKIEALGPSALATDGQHLYIAYRTSSIVLRLPLLPDGSIRKGSKPELIAVFEAWDATKRRSANVIDMAFNRAGELFVACAKEARIWKIGVPNPARPFYGNDQTNRRTSAAPYVDIRKHVGKKAGVGNLLFDSEGRLYFCAGNYDAGTDIAGVVYRAVPTVLDGSKAREHGTR